ncbi:MAG: CBS domain-containing protein [Gemmatimonadetes bacterium]|nr:CBS domain-containing protein [Gemmatimonadota bacterium]
MKRKAEGKSARPRGKGLRRARGGSSEGEKPAAGATVRDIMERDIVTIGPNASVRELAQLLDREGIGGVPVVDAGGAVIGVVSGSDLVAIMATGPAVAGPPPEERPPYFVTPDAPYRWTFREAERRWAEAFQGRTVRHIMTPARFVVRPDATVSEAARFLVRARIHRALVLEQGRLVGIVTTLDVLRALTGV